MTHAWAVVTGVLISVVSTMLIAVAAYLVGKVKSERRQNAQIDRVVQAVIGIPPSPDGTIVGQPSLMQQVAELREGQIAVTEVAKQAADDVSAIRNELTNGGTSPIPTTKDIVHQSTQSAEAAAADAALARQSSERTEELLRRHMRNGVQIMEVGVHNDGVAEHNFGRLLAAVEGMGAEVTDLRTDTREYPVVDEGD